MTTIENDTGEQLKLHPLCEIFPEMPAAEFQELKNDIAGRGLDQPIVLCHGMILDGRHRFRACCELGIQPEFVTFSGPGSATDYVIAANILRRHLNETLRASLGAQILGVHMEMAKRLQQEGGRIVGRQNAYNLFESVGEDITRETKLEAPVPQASFSESVDELLQPTVMAPQAPLTATQRAAVGAQIPDNHMETVKRERQEGRAPQARDIVAAKVQVSPKSIQNAQTILTKGNPEEVAGLKAGTIALKPTAEAINAREKAAAKAPVAKAIDFVTLTTWNKFDQARKTSALAVKQVRGIMNEQDSSKIEWAHYSWNPVTGCKHTCPYCYARDLTQRFPDGFPQGFEPTLLPYKLGQPAALAVPKDAGTDVGYKNIFTCSMADLFGKWVPAEWIEKVLEVARANPQWNFLFLTKFPTRLAEFEFTQNCWVGATVDLQARVAVTEKSMASIKGAGVKWLSIEPMIEPIEFDFSLINWAVIGGSSRSSNTPEWKPPIKWTIDVTVAAVDSGCAVYHKDNLGITAPRMRDYPGMPPAKVPTAPIEFNYLKQT